MEQKAYNWQVYSWTKSSIIEGQSRKCSYWIFVGESKQKNKINRPTKEIVWTKDKKTTDGDGYDQER